MPNVLVSSTASRSFSYKISGVGYGGKSSLLKQVCALKNNNNKNKLSGKIKKYSIVGSSYQYKKL